MKIKNILLALSFLSVNSSSFGQEAEFQIDAELSNDRIIMTCPKGCGWSKLEVTNTSKETWYIDNSGASKSSNEGLDHLNFAFNIRSDGRTILLEGIKGTAWVNLSFAARENVKSTFDQRGVSLSK